MKKEKIAYAAARDLTRHLDTRFEIAMQDFVDRCDVVGVNHELTLVLMLTALGRRHAAAAQAIKANEAEFLTVCRQHWRMERRRA